MLVSGRHAAGEGELEGRAQPQGAVAERGVAQVAEKELCNADRAQIKRAAGPRRRPQHLNDSVPVVLGSVERSRGQRAAAPAEQQQQRAAREIERERRLAVLTRREEEDDIAHAQRALAARLERRRAGVVHLLEQQVLAACNRLHARAHDQVSHVVGRAFLLGALASTCVLQPGRGLCARSLEHKRQEALPKLCESAQAGSESARNRGWNCRPLPETGGDICSAAAPEQKRSKLRTEIVVLLVAVLIVLGAVLGFAPRWRGLLCSSLTSSRCRSLCLLTRSLLRLSEPLRRSTAGWVFLLLIASRIAGLQPACLQHIVGATERLERTRSLQSLILWLLVWMQLQSQLLEGFFALVLRPHVWS